MDNPLYSNPDDCKPEYLADGDREWIRSTRRELWLRAQATNLDGADDQPAYLFSGAAWAIYGALSLLVGIICRVCGAPGFAIFFWTFAAICLAVMIDEAVYQGRLERSITELED